MDYMGRLLDFWDCRIFRNIIYKLILKITA